MAKFRITGLDQMQKKLERLQKNAEELDGKNVVSFDDLFPPDFMRAHSSFISMQALYDASPFKDIAFKDISDAEWDNYVIQSTNFKSWRDMKASGTKQWASRKLMKGVN